MSDLMVMLGRLNSPSSGHQSVVDRYRRKELQNGDHDTGVAVVEAVHGSPLVFVTVKLRRTRRIVVKNLGIFRGQRLGASHAI